MQPKPILPPRLRAGSRVALLAPSGPIPDNQDIATASSSCASLGFEPVVMPHASGRWGYLAGRDEERLADLNRAINDPDIDAIWCLRGGSGLNRIISAVDFAAFAKRPKVVLGYSDITVLLLALWTRTAVVTFHGPVARTPMTTFSRSHLERLLCHGSATGLLNEIAAPGETTEGITTVAPGVARGRLIPGNLSLLQTLAGTPYLPDLDGAILCFEDVNEAVYRIDRMLAHLRLAGAFDRLAGVMIGQVTDVPSNPGDDVFGLAGLWQEYFGARKIPVATGFPVGHIASQWTLPVGVNVELDATAGHVTILDGAVQ